MPLHVGNQDYRNGVRDKNTNRYRIIIRSRYLRTVWGIISGDVGSTSRLREYSKSIAALFGNYHSSFGLGKKQGLRGDRTMTVQWGIFKKS